MFFCYLAPLVALAILVREWRIRKEFRDIMRPLNGKERVKCVN
jgi:hypothetical protein